jgi:hypothetical protein
MARKRLSPYDHMREASTPAFLLWTTSLHFLKASRTLSGDSLASRYLACHGIELALKSQLRSKGYSLEQLRFAIGHSIVEAMAKANATGMRAFPDKVRRILEFAHEIHVTHEYRYPHLHEKFIAANYLIFAGAWTLRAAITAVSKDEFSDRPKGLKDIRVAMKRRADELIRWATPKTPPSGGKAIKEVLARLVTKETGAASIES